MTKIEKNTRGSVEFLEVLREGEKGAFNVEFV
jgi:hypothetical protein